MYRSHRHDIQERGGFSTAVNPPRNPPARRSRHKIRMSNGNLVAIRQTNGKWHERLRPHELAELFCGHDHLLPRTIRIRKESAAQLLRVCTLGCRWQVPPPVPLLKELPSARSADYKDAAPSGAE